MNTDEPDFKLLTPRFSRARKFSDTRRRETVSTAGMRKDSRSIGSILFYLTSVCIRGYVYIYLFPAKCNLTFKRPKAALRKQIRGALEKISPAARTTLSAQIRDRLKEQAVWKNAGSVLFFAPRPDELDLWPLLEDALAAGKIAALPRYHPAGQKLCRVPGAKCAE